MSYQQYRPAQFKFLPDVVKHIMIINGIVFLADQLLSDKFGLNLISHFGLYYPASVLFKPYQFLTHLFMHGSFGHILSNMFWLWMFGSMLENVWGGKRFLTFYLITGLGAALIHTMVTGFEVHQVKDAIEVYAVNPNIDDFELLVRKYQQYGSPEVINNINMIYNNWKIFPDDPGIPAQSVNAAYELMKGKLDVPTVGASGAVFGILIAFGMLFPNTEMFLIFFPFFPIKAKYMVMAGILYELYSGFANNPADNVAHFAHLGGALFGFLLVKIWNKNNRQTLY